MSVGEAEQKIGRALELKNAGSIEEAITLLKEAIEETSLILSRLTASREIVLTRVQMFAASQDPVVTTPGTPINLELRKYIEIAIDSWERVPREAQEAFTIDNFRNILAMLEQGVEEAPPAKEVASVAPKKKSGCFIATAVYGSSLASDVLVFRRFRDQTLLKSCLGSCLVEIYDSLSPPLASVISKSEFLKRTVRKLLLAPLLGVLRDRTK